MTSAPPSITPPDDLSAKAPPGERRDRVVRVLAIGWGVSVAMWAIAYVTMMGPGLALGELLAAAMAGCLFGGGYLAGRQGGLRSGLAVGLVSAAVNLLLVGSLFGGSDPARPDHVDLGAALTWLAALFGVSLFFAGLGGWVGGRRPATSRSVRWTGVFATVTVAAVFLLLITGGLVTGLRAGLAVPDWPNSFGHNMLLYPLSEMKGGVYYEHAHRLYGMLVGLSMLVLAVLVWLTDRRAWVRWLAVAALAMVIAQGLMGGLRVTGTLTLSQDPSLLRPSTALAIAHGIFGQVVFATVAVLAAGLSGRWLSAPPPTPSPEARRDRVLTIVLLALLLVQLFLGVSYRQLRTWAPPDTSPPAWALHGHLTMALVVMGVTAWVALRAASAYPEAPRVARLGRVVLAILGLQVALGIASLVSVLVWPTGELPALGVALTTAHQATGALLLAHVAMLAAWERRLVRPAASSPA